MVTKELARQPGKNWILSNNATKVQHGSGADLRPGHGIFPETLQVQ